jgi:hypothetical protein
MLSWAWGVVSLRQLPLKSSIPGPEEILRYESQLLISQRGASHLAPTFRGLSTGLVMRSGRMEAFSVIASFRTVTSGSKLLLIHHVLLIITPPRVEEAFRLQIVSVKGRTAF